MADHERATPGSVASVRTGLLIDWGGVLTSSVFGSFQAFCVEQGLAPEAVREAFRRDPDAREALVAMESGDIDETEFEVRFARALDLAEHEGMTDRLFAGMRPDAAMLDAVRSAHAQGVRTGLISNSWGIHRYDPTMLAELFDGVVLSARERMRKPDPQMYVLGAERIGLAPEQCLFVDDLPHNLAPAAELGMATVLHRTADESIPQIEALLGLSLH
jgi:putative hydrolase of the HAD superfamily